MKKKRKVLDKERGTAMKMYSAVCCMFEHKTEFLHTY